MPSFSGKISVDEGFDGDLGQLNLMLVRIVDDRYFRITQ